MRRAFQSDNLLMFPPPGTDDRAGPAAVVAREQWVLMPWANLLGSSSSTSASSIVRYKIVASSWEDAKPIPDYIAFGVLFALIPWGVRWLRARH